MDKKDIDKMHGSIYNCIYNNSLEPFKGEIRWNPLKSARLKFTRGVSFEEIFHAKILDVIDHPRRNDQLILVCEYKGYIWLVPFIPDEKGIFLKTIYQSRKYKKLYRKR